VACRLAKIEPGLFMMSWDSAAAATGFPRQTAELDSCQLLDARAFVAPRGELANGRCRSTFPTFSRGRNAARLLPANCRAQNEKSLQLFLKALCMLW